MISVPFHGQSDFLHRFFNKQLQGGSKTKHLKKTSFLQRLPPTTERVQCNSSLNDLIISSGWSSYSKNLLFIYCLGTDFNFPFLVELAVIERVSKNVGVFFLSSVFPKWCAMVPRRNLILIVLRDILICSVVIWAWPK